MQRLLLAIGLVIFTPHVRGADGVTCPLAATRMHNATAEPPAIATDPTCLVSARAVGAGPIYDLRSRSEYLEFHIPGAEHSSPSALALIRRGSTTSVVAYDSGKSRSNAFLLCAQLRRAGLSNVRLVDGGVAAWAQLRGQPQQFALSRLSDDEISGALSDRHSRISSLSPALKSVLTEHRLGIAPVQGAKRLIILAEPTTPEAKITTPLGAARETAFYWVGSGDRLRDLIHSHLLRDQKRLAGPNQSASCSAL